MDTRIGNMTKEEFKLFVSPAMLAEAEKLGDSDDNSNYIALIKQIIDMADDMVRDMMIERFMGLEEPTTPQGTYVSIFMLGMICEREGWNQG